MPALPNYVQILRPGFSEQPDFKVDRTEMESGPAKQAPINSLATVPRPMTLAIKEKADYLSFRTWVRVDLVNGSGWFDWTDPIDGVTKSARIVGGRYEASPGPGLRNWRIKTTFETWG